MNPNLNFLLDTTICSAYFVDHPKVFNRVIQYGQTLAISAVTVGEVCVATAHRGPESRLARGMVRLLRELTVLPFDLDVARRFGEVRADLLSRGLDTGVPDAMIAATALVYQLTLVTCNVGHFVNVPGLRVQNWLL